VGRSSNVTFGTHNLGAAYWLAGETDRGLELLRQSELFMRDMENPYDHGYAAAFVAAAEAYAGHYATARQQAQTVLDQARRLRHQYVVGRATRILGWVALAEGQADDAYQYLQESVATYRTIGEQENVAWSLAPFGLAAYYANRRREARAALYEALKISDDIRAFIPTQFTLPAVALLLADQEEMGLALDLYGLAFGHPFVRHSQLFKDLIDKPLSRLTEGLPAELLETAKTREPGRDRWPAIKTLLKTLAKLGWAS
jgi:hypothetical protein